MTPEQTLPLLQNLRSLRDLRLLFQKLNYSPAFESIPTFSLGETKSVEALQTHLRGEIEIVAQAAEGGFNVFHIPLAPLNGDAAALSLATQRGVVNLLSRHNPYALSRFSFFPAPTRATGISSTSRTRNASPTMARASCNGFCGVSLSKAAMSGAPSPNGSVCWRWNRATKII